MKIIILAGGSGTRLFPLSRTCFPKQFLHIAGNKSLMQQTIERFEGLADPRDMVILTNSDYLFTVKQQLSEIHAEEAHIVCEPIGRNTAPSIALAMDYCMEEMGCDEDEVLFVTPSDHLVQPKEAFQQLIRSGMDLVQKQYILTLGIVPTRPETG